MTWHEQKSFQGVTISETGMGCGTMYLRNGGAFRYKDSYEKFKKEFYDYFLNTKFNYRNRLCGTFLYVENPRMVSQSSTYEQNLKDFGFKVISTYKNLAHHGFNDIQNLYAVIIDFEELKKQKEKKVKVNELDTNGGL